MKANFNSRFNHDFVETFQDGECIFKEGDSGTDLYIVQKGSVRIVKEMSGDQIEIAAFERGDFFGDIGLLQNVPRYASAYAVGEVRLLILGRAGFLLKIRRDPTFAFEMLQQLSHRVKISLEGHLKIIDRFALSKEEVQNVLRELTGKL